MKGWALVTGAAGDIGRAIARMLHEEGYDLWLTDIDQPRLKKLQKELPSARSEIIDLADPHALEAFCQRVETNEETLALALINAGTIMPGDLIERPRENIDRQLDINLRSALHLNQAASRKMKSQPDGGHLINMVSMGGIIPMQRSGTYTATKAGLRGFLAAIREELRPHGVFVSGIYPSGVDTKMLRYEATHGGSHLNHLGSPASVESVVKTVRRAMKTRRLECYVSYIDSVEARLISAFPWLLKYLNPALNWIGQRGHRKFLKERGLRSTETDL